MLFLVMSIQQLLKSTLHALIAFSTELEATRKLHKLFFCAPQDELNSDLDMSEVRASLLSGDVVELINATSVDSTSTKLLWEVKYMKLFPLSCSFALFSAQSRNLNI